eukprot:TRINITY_DN8323_c0_g2_i1.p1 TRINITY_DN8323_c0_g2~~TRINITY_DN8323_c0_g2_i1.p1  ORF type:complete len:723 (+),score=58.20 TRINITY_DN8323_c0_g2_i1:81-2249(+)
MARVAASAATGCSPAETGREDVARRLRHFDRPDEAWPDDQLQFGPLWETTAGLLGLLNAGGTCTVNAAAQGLLSLPPVVRWLEQAPVSPATTEAVRVRQALFHLKQLQDTPRFRCVMPRELLLAFYTANTGGACTPGDVQSVDDFVSKMADNINVPVGIFGCRCTLCHLCPDGHRDPIQVDPVNLPLLWFIVPRRKMVTDHTRPAATFTLQEVVDTCFQPDVGTNLTLVGLLERGGGPNRIPEEMVCAFCASNGGAHDTRARLELQEVPDSFSVVLTRSPPVLSGDGPSGADHVRLMRRPLLLKYEILYGNHAVDLRAHLSPECRARGEVTYKLAAILTRIDYHVEPQGNSLVLDTAMGHNVATVRRAVPGGEDIWVHVDDEIASVRPPGYRLPAQPTVLLFSRAAQDGGLRRLPQDPRRTAVSPGDAAAGPAGQPPTPPAPRPSQHIDPRFVRDIILDRAATLFPGWVLGHAAAPLHRQRGRGLLCFEDIMSVLQAQEHHQSQIRSVWDALCREDSITRAGQRQRSQQRDVAGDRGRPATSDRPDGSHCVGSHRVGSHRDGSHGDGSRESPFRIVLVAKFGEPIHHIISINLYFDAVPSWSVLDLMVRLQLQSEVSALLANQHRQLDRATLDTISSPTQLWRVRASGARSPTQWVPIRTEETRELAKGDMVWAQLAGWQRPPDPTEIPTPSRPASLVTPLPQQRRPPVLRPTRAPPPPGFQ